MTGIRTLTWVLLAIAVAIMVGGLIYDGTKEGEDPNLAPLYIMGVLFAAVAVATGALESRRSRRR